jgi:predicted DCC family thiol-disulfide oxidoreductase YuxK
VADALHASGRSSDRPQNADGVQRIVFFDGQCGLCNAAVRFLMRRDSKGMLRFAPLRGETARQWVPADLRSEGELSTMVYARIAPSGSVELSVRSTAVLQVLADLGGVWAVAAWLKAVPLALREWVYRLVARNRHRLFGSRQCELPDAKQRSRLLP